MVIEVIAGPDKGKHFKIFKEQALFIGRDVNCQVCIQDGKSSRRHGKIYWAGDIFVFEDMNSTNGSLVNGDSVRQVALNINDEIMIGDTILLFKEDNFFDETSSGSSSVHLQEEDKSLIVSALPYKEADLYKGEKKEDANLSDLLIENKLLRQVGEITQLVAQGGAGLDILQEVLSHLKGPLEADTACILVPGDREGDWILKAKASEMGGDSSDEMCISRTIISQALSEGVAILSADTMSDDRFDPSMSIISEGISSAICTPLIVRDQCHGVLFFDRRNSDKVFTAHDLRLTATVGNLLALFLEKEELALEARKKERLAVIGEVIAGLAHHTKNIITGLKFSISALEIVLKKSRMDDIPKCLKSISAQERRISDLVLNMLSYSKERIPIRGLVDLVSLIEDVSDPYQQHFNDQDIHYSLHAPSSMPKVYVEEAAIHRVFLNLLINTLDSFKHKEGTYNKQINITLNVVDHDVHVEVFDTGCGIPKNKLDEIFTVFFSTKGSEGTGLGLAVVNKIIREHGGKILVDSVENEWTKFTIVLPVEEEKTEQF